MNYNEEKQQLKLLIELLESLLETKVTEFRDFSMLYPKFSEKYHILNEWIKKEKKEIFSNIYFTLLTDVFNIESIHKINDYINLYFKIIDILDKEDDVEKKYEEMCIIIPQIGNNLLLIISCNIYQPFFKIFDQIILPEFTTNN